MNRTDELRQLIKIFGEENRRIIGNCSSAFPSSSRTYNILNKASNYAHLIRNDAKQKIEDVFLTTVYWEDDDSIVKENAQNYAWSLVYNFHESTANQIEAIRKKSIDEWVDKMYDLLPKDKNLHPTTKRVKDVTEWLYYAFEKEIENVGQGRG